MNKNRTRIKKVLIGFVLLVAVNCFAQQKAKVQKINEIEVYLLAEPIREYKTLKSSGKGIQWGSVITGGLINESIATKVTQYCKKIANKYKKQNIDIDGIIYSKGKKMTAIKFTDDKTDKNDRIATVQTLKGIPFFVMSEPVSEYKSVKTIGGGIKWKSAMTNGLINNSIEQDLMKFANKMDTRYKKKQISGIIYKSGKKAKAIKFTEQ